MMAVLSFSEEDICQVLLLVQVQGLMEIFQREWCNIYLWTVNGSAMFHIPRDRPYWNACFEVLSEYWWAHLVPAKHAIANSGRDEAYKFMCVAFIPLQKTHLGESCCLYTAVKKLLLVTHMLSKEGMSVIRPSSN